MNLGNVLNYSDQNIGSNTTKTNIETNDNKPDDNIKKIGKRKSKRSRMTLSCVVCRKRKVKVSCFFFKISMILSTICFN